MNQRGEITLVSCFLIIAFTGLVLLCALELKRSFALLEKRTQLFLCVKETKGEFQDFMKFMGRTNWGIKNINRVSLIMFFIPGLQGAATNAQKAKKYLQYVQEARVLAYYATLAKLKSRCPLDPRMFRTPFQMGERLLKRSGEGAALLREKEWAYMFFSRPYLLAIKVIPSGWENIRPAIKYETSEKAVRFSSLLFLRSGSGAFSSGASFF